ncbi:hypothetical protein HHK36_008259 [Tetracentron sinense]|uniref:BZIP domain-containing protein n=1 Tax=Tetracentron sinense TaxID=13715 RepID=A0A834ZF35_TETSI|nr:hypothetical protein HHK36_008259 [Tetracentron sinense]
MFSSLEIFPAFEDRFTPWEGHEHELTSLFQLQDPVNSNPGSNEPDPAVSAVDERKQKRMISNRESARRSRMRKQRHLEDLRNLADRLRTNNRVIATRLGSVTLHCHRIRRDNDRLLAESVALRQRLSYIRKFLNYRQLQQFSSMSPFNTVTSVNEQTPSLIA